VLQCVAVCCSVLQCVAVCCSVLQCVAVSSTLGGNLGVTVRVSEMTCRNEALSPFEQLTL